ncbi:MAG: hypothetical protein RI894_223 [Bacteroidota bacterium]
MWRAKAAPAYIQISGRASEPMPTNTAAYTVLDTRLQNECRKHNLFNRMAIRPFLLRWGKREAQPYIPVAVRRVIVVTVGGIAVPRVVVPTAAAQYAVLAFLVKFPNAKVRFF